MANLSSQWSKSVCIPVVLLIACATCFAAVDPTTAKLTIPNITKSGQLNFKSQSGPYPFNYTVTKGKFTGSCKGKIKNLSNKAQSYKNQILINGLKLTVTKSLYTVPAGATPVATLTCSGTSP